MGKGVLLRGMGQFCIMSLVTTWDATRDETGERNAPTQTSAPEGGCRRDALVGWRLPLCRTAPSGGPGRRARRSCSVSQPHVNLQLSPGAYLRRGDGPTGRPGGGRSSRSGQTGGQVSAGPPGDAARQRRPLARDPGSDACSSGSDYSEHSNKASARRRAVPGFPRVGVSSP